jgi:hypothetical protein
MNQMHASLGRWILTGTLGCCLGFTLLNREARSAPPEPTAESARLPQRSEIAKWPLDRDGRELVSGATAILLGNPTFALGQVHGALSLDGTSQSARVPATAALDIGAATGLSIQLWIKPGAVAIQQPLLEWSDAKTTTGLHFWISVSSPASGGGPGSLFANLISTAGTANHVSSAPGLVIPDQFQLVALTYDRATGMARLYRNGVPVAASPVGAFNPETRTDLFFGHRPVGQEGWRFAGLMDEVVIHRRALSDGEILGNFRRSAVVRGRERLVVPAFHGGERREAPTGPLPPLITPLGTAADGSMRWRLTGERQADYEIESSSDLVHWTATQRVSTTQGEAVFVERSDRPATFYRARQVR